MRGASLLQALLLLTLLPLAALPAQGSHPCPSDPAPDTARDACVEAALPMAEGFTREGEHILLLGQGQARVMLSGAEKECVGASQMVLEAGRKPGGFEPTVTFAYGGARQAGAYLLPCAQGQLRQPMSWNLDAPFGGFGGAWSATYEYPNYTWHLDVGAPVDGHREVHFLYRGLDGLTRHAFDGLAYEVR